MRKTILLAVLGLLVLNVPMALADTTVQSPTAFTLKIGEKATVTNQNMAIKFIKIGSIAAQSYPVQIIKNVEISVTSPGGCGPNADPKCLGAPAFANTFTISEGGSTVALALKINVKNITNDSAMFLISTEDTTVVPPTVITDGNTVIVPIGEGPGTQPGGTPGGVVGGSGGVAYPVIVSPGGTDTICFYGATGETCNDRKAMNTTGGVEAESGSLPTNLNLPDTVTVQSVVKVEATEDASAYYEVKTERRARLLFLFPVSSEITYSVNSETGASTVVSRPWWNFLAW